MAALFDTLSAFVIQVFTDTKHEPCTISNPKKAPGHRGGRLSSVIVDYAERGRWKLFWWIWIRHPVGNTIIEGDAVQITPLFTGVIGRINLFFLVAQHHFQV